MCLSFPVKVIVSISLLILFYQINDFLGPDFDKIAGSDLDGDKYFVSYFSKIISFILFNIKKGLLG